MSQKQTLRDFARELERMSDTDIGRYASGGYGEDKRKWFVSMLRSLARVQAREGMRVV